MRASTLQAFRRREELQGTGMRVKLTAGRMRDDMRWNSK